MAHAFERQIARREDGLKRTASMLEALSYHATLDRGFAIVRNEDGDLIRSRDIAAATSEMTVTFADGDVAVTPSGAAAPKGRKPKATPSKKGEQGSLF